MKKCRLFHCWHSIPEERYQVGVEKHGPVLKVEIPIYAKVNEQCCHCGWKRAKPMGGGS